MLKLLLSLGLDSLRNDEKPTGKKNTTIEWGDGGKIGNRNKLILTTTISSNIAKKHVSYIHLFELMHNAFKYHLACTDGKISLRINLLFHLHFPPSSHLIYACFCHVGLSFL